MNWGSLSYHIKHALTRPRALWRVSRAFGPAVALKLLRIRFGPSKEIHEIRIHQWPDPVYVRGGSSSDAVVLFEIAGTDEYGHVGHLGSPKLILDCGANIGLASRYFLHKYPSARIIAVEPGPETANVCRLNLKACGDRVRVVQGAVWSSDGALVFEPTAQELTASVRLAKATETAETKAYSIPSLIEFGGGGRVDLLKIDVEGAEREIFGPNAQEWLPSVSNLVIELHGPDCEKSFFSAMAHYDYDLSRHDMVFVCRNIRPKRAGSPHHVA